MLFTTSLRAFLFARRKDVVNNSARRKNRLAFKILFWFIREAFTHRPVTNICYQRSTSLAKLSGRAARLCLERMLKNQTLKTIHYKYFEGQSQREGN